MYSNRDIHKKVRYALCTALAASLAAGCATNPLGKVNARAASAAKANYADDKDIAKVEKKVSAEPNDASLRVQLASDYLAAGRFESAATTFEDAIALGDRSPRTALSLSLAYVGLGRNADALALLKQWRDSIPASDYGLAIALAGDTKQGVSILAGELRGGHADAKLRQNLAYAYALDGRWREARLMVAQDIPADKVDSRISTWAREGRPEDFRKRVAGLLGAPVRSDSGQPEFLALKASERTAAPMMASAAGTSSDAPDGSAQELPPIASGADDWGAKASEPTSLLMPVASANADSSAGNGPATVADHTVASAPVGNQFDQAFADSSEKPAPVAHNPAPAVHSPAPLAYSEASTPFLSKPVVQPVPRLRDTKPSRTSHTHEASQLIASGSGYLVQLGSFSSPENAKRAWKIYKSRYPSLSDQDLHISEALVRGKKFWRVAVAGFDMGSAHAMCSTVKGRGYGCIAYSASRPLPGALPDSSGSEQRLASR